MKFRYKQDGYVLMLKPPTLIMDIHIHLRFSVLCKKIIEYLGIL